MITVIGLGFVGLTTALGFCEKGFKVYGYDIDREKVNSLRNNKVPFYEPGLDEALIRHSGELFEIVDDLSKAINNSKVVFYCVGTPSDEQGRADLKFLFSAIDDTLKNRTDGNFKVLVVKSTVPPSTTSERILPYLEQQGLKVGKDIGLANNPEFLREGYSWDDFIKPDRIVIGHFDNKSIAIITEIYKAFNAPIHSVSLNSGEFIKYLSNTLLATMISFANEMSMAADAIGDIDIAKAFEILHEDKRWYGEPAKMAGYVYPGCGFGGYCLPKDTQAMIMQLRNKGFQAQILDKVMLTNETVKDFVIDKVASHINTSETVGILGLSFKANSDDVRQTPVKPILDRLIEKGFENIIAYDPMSNEAFGKLYNMNIEYADSLEELMEKADATLLLTTWPEFKEKKNLIQTKPLFDFRYFL
jgi:UDPglucose 6-dehydrogenase